MSGLPMVHAQRILHRLRDVETTLRSMTLRQQPPDPGLSQLVIEVGLLRKTVERALEALVP